MLCFLVGKKKIIWLSKKTIPSPLVLNGPPLINSENSSVPNAGFMFDHRLQRCPNVKTALGQGVVFAGNYHLRGVICRPRP